jgi:hypothetical protein
MNELRIEDLHPDAMLAMLTARAADLSDAQAEQVDEFIVRIGGMENAWRAIEILSEIE